MESNSFQRYLESLHRDYAGITSGAVASYIPELLRADPAWFGIALVTVDGHVYQAGDSRQAFTIQSISKAITYGLALEDQGIEKVLRKVDVEPSNRRARCGGRRNGDARSWSALGRHRCRFCCHLSGAGLSAAGIDA